MVQELPFVILDAHELLQANAPQLASETLATGILRTTSHVEIVVSLLR